MRERWARGLALATGLLVLVLSAAFAVILNPADRKPVADAVPPQAAETNVGVGADANANAVATAGSGNGADAAVQLVARGQVVFAQQDCARCHSVAGKGNPRVPLDGVGSRLSHDELHDWVVGGEPVRDDLSPRAISAKRRYAALAAADMAALLAYLASLRE